LSQTTIHFRLICKWLPILIGDLQMKIFVAGATGAIGRPLIKQLQALGHHITALTRSPEKARTLNEQGIEPAIADVFDADAVKAAVIRAQPEVVIEQLTSLPKTYTPKSMQAAAESNNRIRLEGGANVLAAAQAAGVRRYLALHHCGMTWGFFLSLKVFSN
jgi:2-alkyl-3-oxoalkanoate reductase